MAKEKLVRDRIPDRSAEFGLHGTFRIARKSELPKLLGEKLLEEALEAQKEIEIGNRKKIIEELADIKEVIRAIEIRFSIAEEEVDFRRRKKRITNGAFSKGNVFKERKIKGS